MAPFSPETAAFRAGRLMLIEIDLLAQRRADFGFETTLSGRSYMRLIGRLKNQGYAVHFFFLWLSSRLALTVQGCGRIVTSAARISTTHSAAVSQVRAAPI
jgi:predicted ABC-type ATPase